MGGEILEAAQVREADEFVVLVERVLEKSFGEQFPFSRECDGPFVGALLACIAGFVPDFESQSPEVIDRFADGLALAVDCIRRQQAARWQN